MNKAAEAVYCRNVYQAATNQKRLRRGFHRNRQLGMYQIIPFEEVQLECGHWISDTQGPDKYRKKRYGITVYRCRCCSEAATAARESR